MLKTKVIASNISNLTDARFFAAKYVDWLGFNLKMASEDKMTLEEVKAIKEWIEGPLIVGELDILDIEESQAIIDYLELTAIQVDMLTPVAYLNSLSNLTIIKEVVIEPMLTVDALQAHIDTYFDVVDCFLLDFTKNGWTFKDLQNNKLLNINHLKEICQKVNILLKIDAPPTEVADLLNQVQPYGLSLSGSEEEKVGYKSFEEIEEVFEVLEEF